ncbi:MAG: NrfD/PsrC family molybdoenzyme membrane anchor subunit [Dehalococcoidia bacterium]|nr:NrfD/PsrC family molybdoenzyme membrane anchor subunit [Dehalococcoidia bacterium]
MAYSDIREYRTARQPSTNWLIDQILMGKSLPAYLRSLITPFNIAVTPILVVGMYLTFLRFTQGLESTTNLTNNNPWGLWIGFDVLSGVALAAGCYTMATAVHVFKLEAYRPLVRPAILTGFLGYLFVVVGLCFDLGRPWRLPFPMGVSMGFTSVMFLVAWHVALYLGCQFVEFSPAVAEWLHNKKLRRWTVRIALGATIFGLMLSTLHQSALGALYLVMPGKLFPLWYSPMLPIFFFISSMAAGLSVVIVESTISHRAFHDKVGISKEKLDNLTLGLARAASPVLFTYFAFKLVGIADGRNWEYLFTPLGYWFMAEIGLFVLVPSFLYLWGAQTRNVPLVRLTAFLTIIGIVLNRLNVSLIAFNWQLADRYVPRWSEIFISIFIVTLLILTYRWVVNRMPVLRDDPGYSSES